MIIPKMSFNVKVDLPDRLVRPAFIKGVAVDAIAIIRRRVQVEGKGLDDTKMLEYAESTKKQREARGRVTSRRTLTDTGRMMGDIHVVQTSLSESGGVLAVIGFASGRGRMLAGIQQARTPWFGFSRIDKQKIKSIVDDRIADEVQRMIDNP